MHQFSTQNSFAALLQRARAGDADALGAILEAFRPYLGLLADREIGTDLQAKVGASDMVQKTFLDAHQDFPRFEGISPGEFQAWLEKMLHHNLIDCGRFWRGTEKRSVGRETPLDSESKPLELVGEDTTPSKQAISREEKKALDDALCLLPEDYRRVILLRYQERLAFEDIAAVLDRSAEAVRKLWGRAVVQLQKVMREAGWNSRSSP